MDAQQELFKRLAETRLRGVSIRRIGSERKARIPAQQQELLSANSNLREQILTAGIGRNPEAEKAYLANLDRLYLLDQSYELAPDQPPDAPGMDADLAKTVRYGAMVLQVYGGCLQKSANVQRDIHAIAQRLTDSDHPQAIALGKQLRKLSP